MNVFFGKLNNSLQILKECFHKYWLKRKRTLNLISIIKIISAILNLIANKTMNLDLWHLLISVVYSRMTNIQLSM